MGEKIFEVYIIAGAVASWLMCIVMIIAALTGYKN